jgi:hypothetical protein
VKSGGGGALAIGEVRLRGRTARNFHNIYWRTNAGELEDCAAEVRSHSPLGSDDDESGKHIPRQETLIKLARWLRSNSAEQRAIFIMDWNLPVLNMS